MTFISNTLWIIVMLVILIPALHYLRHKFTMYLRYLSIKRMAKNYDGEAAEKLNELAKEMMEEIKTL